MIISKFHCFPIKKFCSSTPIGRMWEFQIHATPFGLERTTVYFYKHLTPFGLAEKNFNMDFYHQD